MTDKKKFDELLEELNAEKIRCESLSYEESIPREIHERIFDNMKYVDEIEVESDRFCKIVTSVIEIYGRYLGITHVSEVHNNNISIYECLEFVKFEQMKKTNKKTFKKK